MTKQEMATEVVKAWISGKSGSAQLIAEEVKQIYASVIEAVNSSYQNEN